MDAALPLHGNSGDRPVLAAATDLYWPRRERLTALEMSGAVSPGFCFVVRNFPVVCARAPRNGRGRQERMPEGIAPRDREDLARMRRCASNFQPRPHGWTDESKYAR